MPQNAPIRAPRAFPSSPPSPWSRAALSAATRSKPTGDPISPPAPCRRRPSPRRRAAIGRSKTSCIGFSTSLIGLGFVTPARRPRRQEHGCGSPLRAQSGTPGRRQTIHQATPQARLVGPAISAGNLGTAAPLTSTRCPGRGPRKELDLRTARSLTESRFAVLRRNDSGLGDSGVRRTGVGRPHGRRSSDSAALGGDERASR
jgi:hypothetical protein